MCRPPAPQLVEPALFCQNTVAVHRFGWGYQILGPGITDYGHLSYPPPRFLCTTWSGPAPPACMQLLGPLGFIVRGCNRDQRHPSLLIHKADGGFVFRHTPLFAVSIYLMARKSLQAPGYSVAKNSWPGPALFKSDHSLTRKSTLLDVTTVDRCGYTFYLDRSVRRKYNVIREAARCEEQQIYGIGARSPRSLNNLIG